MPQHGLDGLIIYDDRKIWIKPDLNEEQAESTLIHEILHALAHHNQFPLHEDKVLVLEKALYSFFKSNGWKIVSK
jgi:Zn-dependent peptidase ImmA (M78 family)